MSPLIQASVFLVDTLFTFYMLAILLRILLQWVRADFYNPICQLILKTTNFFVLKLRRVIPAYYGIDWACVMLLLIAAIIKQTVLVLLQTGVLVNTAGLVLLGIADILSLLFYVYLFSIIMMVIASWLNPHAPHPLAQIALQLIAPPLKKIRQFVPAVAGFDLSPMVFTMLLVLINILIIEVIANAGLKLILA